MEDHFKDNHQNNEDGTYEAVCFVCRRPESKVGHMMHLPGDIHICDSCMQRMMDTIGSFDYNGLLNNAQLMNELNKNMQNKFTGGRDQQTKEAAEEKDKETSKEKTEEQVNEAANEKTEEKAADRTKEKVDEQAKQEEESQENGDDKSSHLPPFTIFNLGELFGGGGIPNTQRVKKKKTGPQPKKEFDLNSIPAPHKIKAKLDDYVIGQEKAKKMISVAVYNHYKRVSTQTMDDIEIEKSNILMIGPTGSGKTYLVRTLAKLLDVPLAIADATSLTEAGYIGDDIESVVSKLLAAAGNDIEKAEQGIVFIDEIDKIARKKNTTSRDVSGESVQQGMLKLLEGSDIEVPVGANSKNAMVPLATVNTRNILFICGGAFPDLEDIIKQRLNKESSIGFTSNLKDAHDKDPDILSKVTIEDLRKYGMVPEFLGRLPVICTLQGLTKEMLIQILKEPKNAILKQYQKLLALDEVELLFDDSALLAIAEKAMKKDTGARALRAIIEEFMLDIMYEIPKDENIGRVTITGDYINGKGGPLIEIRKDEVPKIASSRTPEKS